MIDNISAHWQHLSEPSPAAIPLSANFIDVWLCNLQQLSNNISEFYGMLSNTERKRADKLMIKEKQEQFVITRGCLRQRLGWLTDSDPASFVFDYLEHGKPVLGKSSSGESVSGNDQQYNDITFNVSHSSELALIAISLNQQLGVDIEKVNRDANPRKLVTRFFSQAEQTAMSALPESLLAKAFCASWTRKEAFIKAVGDGVTYGLNNFDVTVDPESHTPDINLHHASDEKWSAFNLPINDDYMACLVSNSENVQLRYWR